MKKSIGRIFAAALAFVMIFALTPSLTAEASTLAAKTVYMTSATTAPSFSILASGATKVSNVKSSNSKVVKPSSYNISKGNSVDLTNKKKSSSNSATVYFQPKKPGKAIVSFKAGKTSYSQKVTVKKYVNPLASLTVSNVNGGKDIHSVFKKSASAPYGTLKAKGATKIKVSAKAIKGWEITYINASNSSSNSKGYLYTGTYRDFSTKASSASCTLNDTGKKGYSYVNVTLRNKKDNGTITISMSLYPKN